MKKLIFLKDKLKLLDNEMEITFKGRKEKFFYLR